MELFFAQVTKSPFWCEPLDFSLFYREFLYPMAHTWIFMHTYVGLSVYMIAWNSTYTFAEKEITL